MRQEMIGMNESVLKSRMPNSAGLIAALLLVFVSGIAGAVEPEALVKETADKVLANVVANKPVYTANKGKLFSMVNAIVLPHFDFVVMSKRVLGKYWKSASSAEKKAFINEFRNLLVRTYATALLNYSGQNIEYKPVRIKKQTALVKTLVRNSGGTAIPIDYRLYKNKSGAWKVYDLSVDSLRIVATYRTQYSAEIRRLGSVGKLVEWMQSGKT
jgi:phospholipid transport system substrate-binding protein